MEQRLWFWSHFKQESDVAQSMVDKSKNALGYLASSVGLSGWFSTKKEANDLGYAEMNDS